MSVSQSDFRAALLDPARPVPEGLRDGAGQPAGRRFSVYRNNVAVSLTEALASGFPALHELLGEANFQSVMGVFLRAHPPQSPVMIHYGAALPAFLEAFAPLAHLPYLADVARLELALRRAYHAADAPPIDPAALGALAPDALAETRLQLAPAVRVLRSRHPVFSVWTYTLHPPAPPPRPGAEAVLVARPGFEAVARLLPPGGATLLLGLVEGATLGAAIARAEAAVAGFDPAPVLALLFELEAITGMKTASGKTEGPDG